MKPVKGSALFWFNMLDIGDVDTRSVHYSKIGSENQFHFRWCDMTVM